MGLDAFVSCRCWEDGLTTTPPVDPARIDRDEDGYLSLNENRDQPGDADWHAVHTWVRDGACPHPRMEIASEHVGNWAGYRLFQAALGDAGWEHAPTLRAHLPHGNGGQLPANEAATALAELEHFVAHARLGDRWVLAEEDTGAELHQYVAVYQGVFGHGPGGEVGVDPGGFFVRERGEHGRELFRATRVHVRPIDRGMELTGPDGTVVAVTGVPAVSRAERWLRVERRPRTVDEFTYQISALRILLRAAADTGNPVVWC